MHHPVTGTEQMSAGMPGLGQVIQHPGHHSPVSPSGKPFLDRCRRKPLDPQRRLWRTEPLADPPMRRSPLREQKRELTDELPELSTSTKSPEPPTAAWLFAAGRARQLWFAAPPRPGFPVTDDFGSPHAQFTISGMYGHARPGAGRCLDEPARIICLWSAPLGRAAEPTRRFPAEMVRFGSSAAEGDGPPVLSLPGSTGLHS